MPKTSYKTSLPTKTRLYAKHFSILTSFDNCISNTSIALGLLVALLACSGCNGLRKTTPESAFLADESVDEGILSGVSNQMMANVRSAVGLGPSEEAAKEAFTAAMGQYRQAIKTENSSRPAAFEDAAKAFRNAAARWPNSSIEEDALFYQGECTFFAERYPKAQSIFGQLVAKYPSSRYIDTVSKRRFQIAKYWIDHDQQTNDIPIAPNLIARDRPTFDRFGNAIKLLERIRLDDPTGDLADDATILAASSCFEKQKYFRADELLSDLRSSFPNSPHQYQAHMLGLKVKIRLYQGPQYDPGPLDAAEEIVKQMRRQFPNESRDDIEFLETIYKDIRMNRAIREMARARARDRRKEYRAARVRYERVVRDYSDTSLARDAEQRLAQLSGLPDLPPQRLQILAKAFPSSSDEQPLMATGASADRR